MPEYDKTNRGAMFKNDRKETDRHPDMKGSVNIEGREFWVSAWRQTSKAGKPYVSLSFTAKEQQGGGPERSYGGGQDRNAPRPQQQSLEALTDDDIPF